MKRWIVAACLAIALLVAIAPSAAAVPAAAGDPARHSRVVPDAERHRPQWDPATIETLKGVVVAVRREASPRGPCEEVYLRVKTSSGILPVYLGPLVYVKRQEVRIRIRERIEVAGSRVMYGGRQVIVAREVHRGASVLRLRDASGSPLWADWRSGV